LDVWQKYHELVSGVHALFTQMLSRPQALAASVWAVCAAWQGVTESGHLDRSSGPPQIWQSLAPTAEEDARHSLQTADAVARTSRVFKKAASSLVKTRADQSIGDPG